MTTDWEQLLLTFLHDPPGKALGIAGHETRASALAQIAFGEAVPRKKLHEGSRTEDILASLIERVLPLPRPGDRYQYAVSPENGKLRVVHPLSGRAEALDLEELKKTDGAERETLRSIVGGIDPPEARFLAVWRLWRDRLTERNPAWGRLPADTRLPDHTVWHHLDTAAGVSPSLEQGGVAILSFSLGPVQPFIAAARTVRDLWTGSYLLSWLTFAAMTPVLEACGPAAILSPSLRGNPLLDRWLRSRRFGNDNAPLLRDRVEAPAEERLLCPCLPNRFTAFVAEKTGRELAEQCESRCREAWKEICDKVRAVLGREIEEQCIPNASSWDRMWNDQVGSFFETQTAVLPINDTRASLAELLPSAGQDAVEALRAAIPHEERYNYTASDIAPWARLTDMLGRLAAARRSVRELPRYQARPDAQDRFPGKCALLGTYEQMGPADHDESRDFWEAVAERVQVCGTRLRLRERMCAVSLVKRFAWPAFLAKKLEVEVPERSYPDTATVAAACWLQKHQVDRARYRDWSGQWLHWTSRDQGKEDKEAPVPEDLWRLLREVERPPAYYAVLMMDGDRLGRWLRGENLPEIQESLHPKITGYYRERRVAEATMNARRPTGPAQQAALSEALANFALHVVPGVVEKHCGALIYAGGDDVLALLPTRAALACASELRTKFREEYIDGRLMMGGRATLSAGLAVVHYKEDLRQALRAAREAEKASKVAGRDRLTVRVVRRSGEDSAATLLWDHVPRMGQLVERFAGGVSDRWAYQLRAELPTLGGGLIPPQARRAEVGRLLRRMEKRSEEFEGLVMGFFDDCNSGDAANLEAFVTLCQSASFLARGRDDR